MTSLSIPEPYRVKTIRHDTADVFTVTLTSVGEGIPPFQPGQFNMLYLFGLGEVAISIASDPSKKHELVHTIRAVGSVTAGLQKLKEGDEIGVRGPFGSAWPLIWPGSDILVVVGGVGFAPLRAALFDLAARRKQYRQVTLLYGARDPDDVIYKEEIAFWQKKGIQVEITVDRADASWKGPVGVVTPLIQKHIVDPANTVAFVCGPEIMMQRAASELTAASVPEERLFLSLERNMQCALGFCGRCQYGPYFICKDGPVFPHKELHKWLGIQEL
jgi:NAD(P)H-flavin reductase